MAAGDSPPLDLGQEPFGPDDCGQLRLQDLQRDVPLALDVVGEDDRRHPALAELAHGAVAGLHVFRRVMGRPSFRHQPLQLLEEVLDEDKAQFVGSGAHRSSQHESLIIRSDVVEWVPCVVRVVPERGRE